MFKIILMFSFVTSGSLLLCMNRLDQHRLFGDFTNERNNVYGITINSPSLQRKADAAQKSLHFNTLQKRLPELNRAQQQLGIEGITIKRTYPQVKAAL